MSALAAYVSSLWVPEDDLLLKNAIESGASLEALAKGAVRFSRKFTVSELQDRWRALLYNPVFSGQASDRMIEALTKMEEDGFFSLKNIGKSSIFINGKEVSTGQLMGLGSSSLVEIRDMAFVFEINQNSVKRYLAKITEKKQEKKTSFEWSEESKRVYHE